LRTLTRVITTYAVVKKSTYVTTLLGTQSHSNLATEPGNSYISRRRRGRRVGEEERSTKKFGEVQISKLIIYSDFTVL
jgi:hypothetical protein